VKRIAVLTSGGDAPGINAAIRAVVRTAIEQGWDVIGVRRGYAGLLAGDFVALGPRDVGGVIERGGTMLGTSRAPEFRAREAQEEAVQMLAGAGIGALVTIGGNGTQQGAQALSALGFPVVGIASTIDNDLYGSDIAIGVDSALAVALEAIDRLKVTAISP
jgi:6-phosphofructokinase 1